MASDAADTVLHGREATLNPITIAKDTVEAIVYHWKNKSINWPMAIYITLVHFAAVVGIFTISDCKWQTLLLAFVLWPITMFFHAYWSTWCVLRTINFSYSSD